MALSCLADEKVRKKILINLFGVMAYYEILLLTKHLSLSLSLSLSHLILIIFYFKKI